MFAKKKLVAAAALMVIAGVAQADVKAYGLMDLSFGSFEGAHFKGVDSRATAVESGVMATSFIGFAGSEDLGGGLKAEFAVESFIHADTGAQQNNLAGGFWGRDSYLAVSGNFGRVILGQYDNTFYGQALSYSAFNGSFGLSPTTIFLFGDSTIANVFTAAHAPYTSPYVGLGFDTSWVNSVTYESPNFGGFNFSAQYAPKEVNDQRDARDAYTLTGSYNAGQFSAMLNYGVSGYISPVSAYPSKKNVVGLGASYDLGVVKLFGQFTQAKTKSASYTFMTLNSYELGAAVPVTAEGTVLVAYGEAKYSGDLTDSVWRSSLKHRIFSLAYDQKLSKRTDVYAGFKNDGSTFLESGQTFAVGIRHAF